MTAGLFIYDKQYSRIFLHNTYLPERRKIKRGILTGCGTVHYSGQSIYGSGKISGTEIPEPEKRTRNYC